MKQRSDNFVCLMYFVSAYVPAHPYSVFWNDKDQVGIQQDATSFLFPFTGSKILEFIIS